MSASDEWDSWADDYDQDPARLRDRRPTKASVKRQWRKAAADEIQDLGGLYGVSPEIVKGGGF